MKKIISLLVILSLLIPRDSHGKDFPFSQKEEAFINILSMLEVVGIQLGVGEWLDKKFALSDTVYSKEFGNVPFFFGGSSFKRL